MTLVKLAPIKTLGGMITAPVRTLRQVARDGVSPALPIVLLIVTTLLIEQKVLGRLLFLVADGGTTILKRMRETVFDALRTDVLLLLITAVVLGVLARFLARGRISAAAAAAAAAWLTVPLLVLKAVGGALQGFDVDLWWLPHHAVDSAVVIVGRQVSWLRFTVKCAVAYGIPLALAVTLLWSFKGAAADTGPQATAPLPPWRLRAGLAAFALAFVALVAGSVSSSIRLADRIRPVLAGDQLPDATLRKLDEFGVQKDKVRLTQLTGKVVVLDFWASWCAPCRRSMPELSRMADDYKDKGLVILGINREPMDVPAARKAMGEIKPTFECVIDERGYGERLGLTSLPTSYIVDKKGVVRHLHLGYTEPDIVQKEIEALLAE